jgi:hypothetical protein
MANMSYCRFQNTAQDLRDCVTVVEEAYDLDDLDLSNDETYAMQRMRNLCQDFLDAYECLEEMTGETAE